MKPRRGRRTQRAGYTLALFLMMFFGIMGLAALVIDMGFARLAQHQMQTAVDSAALEGLRWRDVQQWEDLPQGWLADPNFQSQVGLPGTGPLSPQQREMVRRWAASQVVADGPVANGSSAQPSMFADYQDSAGTVHYGAGPVVNFGGGFGPANLAAGQYVISPSDPQSPYAPVYQPKRSDGTPGLELNYPNGTQAGIEGDMVSGTYGQNNADPPDGAADEGTTATDSSGNPYHRRDFWNTSNQAFLVRMRRTSDTSGIDNEQDVSSGGSQGLPGGQYNTIPFLFGRGSTIYQQPGSNYSPRQQGLTVRATAIAAAGDNIQFGGASYSAGRAKTAGPPYQYIDPGNPASAVNVPGVTPFAVASNVLTGGQPLTVASNGSITGGGQVIQLALIEIGQQVGKSITGQNAAWLSQYVAANGTNPVNYTGPTLLALSQYVPVVDSNNTIIGFGYVQSWTWTGDATGGTLNLTIGPSGSVGCGNVSGAFVPVLTLDTTDFTTLFQEHATLSNPLYAPVLVNHYIGPTP